MFMNSHSLLITSARVDGKTKGHQMKVSSNRQTFLQLKKEDRQTYLIRNESLLEREHKMEKE